MGRTWTWKEALAGVLVLGAIAGFSFLEELPKHRFEAVSREAAAKLPGARLIDSSKSADLASPVSWFWSATTNLSYAMPDPHMRDRFVTITFVYDEKMSPIIFLVDADCKARALYYYDLDEPDSAPAAVDLLGDPVVAPNGKTYRTFSSTIPPSPERVAALCDRDWREARTKGRAAP